MALWHIILLIFVVIPFVVIPVWIAVGKVVLYLLDKLPISIMYHTRLYIYPPEHQFYDSFNWKAILFRAIFPLIFVLYLLFLVLEVLAVIYSLALGPNRTVSGIDPYSTVNRRGRRGLPFFG